MFVLVFQNNSTGTEEIRWVAPQEMSDRITELIEAANSPEGQAAMAVENQKKLLVLQSKIGLTMQMSQALVQSGQGLVAAAAAHPVHYHQRSYY